MVVDRVSANLEGTKPFGFRPTKWQAGCAYYGYRLTRMRVFILTCLSHHLGVFYMLLSRPSRWRGSEVTSSWRRPTWRGPLGHRVSGPEETSGGKVAPVYGGGPLAAHVEVVGVGRPLEILDKRLTEAVALHQAASKPLSRSSEEGLDLVAADHL